MAEGNLGSGPQAGSTSAPESPVRFLVLPAWLLAIYAIGVLCADAETIFLWMVAAFFLFVLLDPVAEKLKARGWPTVWTGAFLVIVASAIAIGLAYFFGYLLSITVVELEQSKKLLVHIYHSLTNTWGSWVSRFGGGHAAAEPSSGSSAPAGLPMSSEWGGRILRGLGSAVTIVTFSILVPILAFFLLLERDLFARVFVRAFAKREVAVSMWAGIVRATRAFFLGNLVLALITYPVFVLIFYLFSVPSVFSIAALATFFNLIPFAGAALSGFLPAVTLYTQTQEVGAALGLYGCCVAIHFIVADFVTPKVLGSQVNINATTSTIALVAWGELWGGMGLILAIPLTALIKVIFEHSGLFWLKWIGDLMSEKVEDSVSPVRQPLLPRKRPKPA